VNDQKTTSLPRASNPYVAVALLLAILIFGTFFTWWTVLQADRVDREDLLQQAQLVAHAISIDRIQNLSGAEADLSNPNYLKLKEQLAAVRLANPMCRFLYFLGRKPDGQLFFFVDSEPSSSKDYSPPGQIFGEAPVEYHRMFDTKVTVVDGPIPDRWGVWVSALVPVIDPKTRAVAAVFGMDVDARTWKWDVASKAALPAGLMIVLLIGVGAAFFSSRSVSVSPKPVLRRLMMPLTIMVFLLMVGVGTILWYQHQRQLAAGIANIASEVAGDLHLALDQQTAGLAAALQPIVIDSGLQKALREGDADRLFATWRPVFDAMHRENHLTHFNFITVDRIVLLRVQDPKKRGDLVNRFTILEAERTGKIASGIESGLVGVFTLRVVQPVFAEGKLIGYVELGKEMEEVLKSLPYRPGIQLAVVIRKENLNRQKCEEGMRLLGRDVEWDRLPRSVVIFASQGRLPGAFAFWADSLSGDHTHVGMEREITFQGKDWRLSATPLSDASGKEVGNLLVMSDVSVQKAVFAHLLALGGTGSVVLLMLLLAFLYVLLRRTDAGILAQQTRLQKSEAHFRSYFELPLIGIAVISPSKGWVQVNDRICSLLGYTREELVQMTWSEMTHPEDLVLDIEQFDRLLSGQIEQYTLEKRFIRKDGQAVWTGLSAGCVRDSKGDSEYMVAFINDISERKKAEDEATQEQALNKTIIESIPGTFYMVDANGRYLRWSAYQRDEIVGKPESQVASSYAKDTIHPDDRERVLAKITNVLKYGMDEVVEGRVLLRGGPAFRWMLMTGRRLIIQGNPVLIGIGIDITERKKTEEALSVSKAELDLAMRSAKMGVWQFNIVENKRFFDDQTCSLLGLDPATFGGTAEELYAVIHSEDREKIKAAFARTVEKGVPYQPEYRVVWPDGSIHYITSRGELVRDEKGGPERVHGILWDISEQKQAEELIKDSEERLQVLFEFAPDGYYLLNSKGDFIGGNRMAEVLTGYQKEELIGKSFLKLTLLSLVQMPKAVALLAKNLIGKAGGPDEFTLLKKDGTHVAVEIRTYPVKIKGEMVVLGNARDITERKKAEAALRESEKEKRLLFEQSLAAIAIHEIVLDENGRPVDYVFLNANPAFEIHTGLRLANILGRRATEVLPGIERASFIEIYGKVALTGEPITFEQYAEVLGKHFFINVFQMGKGRFGTVFTDITERKKAEEKITRAAAEWRRTFDSISDMVFILDKEHTLVRANRAVFDAFKVRPEEILGKKCYDWVHRTGHPDQGCPFEVLLNDKKTHSAEVQGPNGEILWVTVSPIFDEHGELQGAVHIASDVTERKKIELEVKEGRDYLKRIMDAVADPIFVKNSEYNWVLFNDAFCKFMGRSADEIFGKTDYAFFPKNEADIFRKKDKEVFENGAESINEESFTDAGGVTHVIVTKKSLYTDLKGEKLLVGIIRDVTELKRIEEELRKHSGHLEELVQDRTVELELSNQKLKMTAEDLKRASKAKSEFLANMSHELRTPLSSVIGFSEVLFDEKFGAMNERQKKYAQNIMSSGRHLLSLINDVLDLSKVEAGKMVLQASLFSVKGCLEEVLRVTDGLAFSKKINPVVEIPDDLGTIHADQRKIKQIVFNLMSNAIKFTPAGGKVGLRVRRDDAGIEVVVWDTGIGIAQENLGRVFEAFTRLEDAYTQETEGTGLGLTITQKIVELHGGTISVKSEGIGKGTSVQFTIPAARGV